jgi:hypothetical protein
MRYRQLVYGEIAVAYTYACHGPAWNDGHEARLPIYLAEIGASGRKQGDADDERPTILAPARTIE